MSDTKISVSAGADTGVVRCMATDNGTHPPEAWAAITADTILDLIEIEPTGSPTSIKAMAAKQELRPLLMARFAEHYRMLQMIERLAVVKKKPSDSLQTDITSICNDFERLIATTMFAAQWSQPKARKSLQRIIGQHSADVMHIERQTFADKQGD